MIYFEFQCSRHFLNSFFMDGKLPVMQRQLSCKTKESMENHYRVISKSRSEQGCPCFTPTTDRFPVPERITRATV